MAGSKRRRHHDDDHEEGHEGNERWLVTYADMVTLLMVLFIVMFAMSTVDEKKYHDLKTGLADGFGRSESILNGSNPMLDDRGPGTPAQQEFDMMMEDLPASTRAVVAKAITKSDQLRNQRKYGEAKAELQRLLKAWQRADKALRANGLRSDVRMSVDERGLVLSLVSQHVVFEPNVADLTARGEHVVDVLAPVLAGLTDDIEIDGHTNQEKVKPKYYPTDWELSAARAVNVLRRLQEVNGLPAARLHATGYGHTKPLVDPSAAGSQRVNKRVDIVILSAAPAGTRALFQELYEAEHPGLDEVPGLKFDGPTALPDLPADLADDSADPTKETKP